MSKIESIFCRGGVLAQNVPSYEERPSQIEMARAIERTIEHEGQLLVEAGTGVGKSLAYLVPFILWARESNKKVLISTYTKTLQHQLVEKDLPFLKRVLDRGLKYVLCVGGQNYLCLRRFNQVLTGGLYESRQEATQINRIIKWKDRSPAGLKSELSFEPVPTLWSKISRESDLCFGRKCPYFSGCYYFVARALQRDAHLLIANHHLFFANLAAGESVLPPYHAVVFDEAHNLEEVAVNYLGVEIANTKVKYLVDTLYNPKTGKGLLQRAGDGALAEEARRNVDEVRATNDFFFSTIVDKLEGKKVPHRFREPRFIPDTLEAPLSRLEHSLRKLKDALPDEEQAMEIAAFESRVSELKENLTLVAGFLKPEQVYWVAVEKRPGNFRVSVNTSSIDIAESLKKLIFDRITPIILTSATLSADGTCDYIKERLGADSAETTILDSPFDYRNNALIYLARDLPDPNNNTDIFQKRSLERIVELLAITRGRTFVLFTSFKFMDEAYQLLQNELEGFTLLKQGDKPQYRMIEDFKALPNAVLLGTNTFWQGVDVPGRALESVIITKLPFAVPDEPLTEARMELMESKSLNPFVHYQVPQAIIWLKQGFGRLIRTRSDRGMVALLDPRIVTRSYGRRFLKSLPPCRISHTLKEVSEFFKKMER